MFKFLAALIIMSSPLIIATTSDHWYKIEGRSIQGIKGLKLVSKLPSIARASYVTNQVYWERNESNNALHPFVHLKVEAQKNFSLQYKDQFIQAYTRDSDNAFFVADLFYQIDNDEKVKIKIINDSENYQLSVDDQSLGKSEKLNIDYSCLPYHLKVLEEELSHYTSLSCKLNEVGSLLKRKPQLRVTLSGRTIQRPSTEFQTSLLTSGSVDFSNQLITSNKLKLSLSLPKKLSRLKTAFGFGPYLYYSRNEQQKKPNTWAPSFMLYAKIDLTEMSSIKAFDALVPSHTFFNNSGLYFSYDLAMLFDQRIIINTLLGFQGIHYKFNPQDKIFYQTIFPQGFEVIYKHAFGLENKNLIYGMFFSTGEDQYINSWIRFGGKVFYEINYIHWNYKGQHVSMAGLSVGLPFFEAF